MTPPCPSLRALKRQGLMSNSQPSRRTRCSQAPCTTSCRFTSNWPLACRSPEEMVQSVCFLERNSQAFARDEMLRIWRIWMKSCSSGVMNLMFWSFGTNISSCRKVIFCKTPEPTSFKKFIILPDQQTSCWRQLIPGLLSFVGAFILSRHCLAGWLGHTWSRRKSDAVLQWHPGGADFLRNGSLCSNFESKLHAGQFHDQIQKSGLAWKEELGVQWKASSNSTFF